MEPGCIRRNSTKCIEHETDSEYQARSLTIPLTSRSFYVSEVHCYQRFGWRSCLHLQGEKRRLLDIHICSSLKQEFRTNVITFYNYGEFITIFINTGCEFIGRRDEVKLCRSARAHTHTHTHSNKSGPIITCQWRALHNYIVIFLIHLLRKRTVDVRHTFTF